MTSLPVLEVEERETDATPGSCSLSWTKLFLKWKTEKRYYGIEIGQTFLIYLGMWDEGER